MMFFYLTTQNYFYFMCYLVIASREVSQNDASKVDGVADVRVGSRVSQFIPSIFELRVCGAGESGSPHADGQASPDQAKAGRLEDHLGWLGGHGWANERGRDSRHP